MIAITANSLKNNTHFLSYGIFLLGIFLLSSCAKLPTHTQYPTEKIVTGPGTEDMVLDTLTDKSHPRLLVSCNARRKAETPHGEIWAVNLQTDQTTIFPRKGEPQGLGFNPHGIDIVSRNGIVYLYVINHQHLLNRHIIMEYQVLADHLEFLAMYENPILTSPNDVCAIPNGKFYWTNDAHSTKTGAIEALLKIKGGYVGNHSADGLWTKSKKNFSYTNGIGVWDNDLYISTARQSKVFRFKNQDINDKPELICKLVGGDNISFLSNGNLLITAHLRQIKFLKHRSNPQIKSPSIVYLVNPNTKEKKVVYADNGNTISAASTAIWYDGYLYVCQVFDGFIIKAKTGTL